MVEDRPPARSADGLHRFRGGVNLMTWLPLESKMLPSSAYDRDIEDVITGSIGTYGNDLWTGWRSVPIELWCSPSGAGLVIFSAKGHHQLHISQTQGKVEVQPHTLGDDFFRESVVAIRVARRSFSIAPAQRDSARVMAELNQNDFLFQIGRQSRVLF